MRIYQIAAILLVLVLAAWWTGRDFLNAPSNVSPPLVVESIPDFTLPDLDDQPRSISEWAGKSLIINFWATWCGPCRREIPLLQSLQNERSDGSLQVIGVALDNLSDIKRFVAQTNMTYPVLYGEHEGAMVAESLGGDFIGLPYSAIVAPGGEILMLHSGELLADDLRRLVAEMDAVANGQRSAAEARASLQSD